MKLILVARLNFSIRYNDVITQTNHRISEIRVIKTRYFRAIEKDQAHEREILSYLDGILSNSSPV